MNFERGKALYSRYRELVNYVIVGMLTTVISYSTYFFFSRLLHMGAVWATVCSDLVAIAFAYVASRMFVFENKAYGFGAVAKEALAFLASRLFSMGVNALIMYVSVDVLSLNDAVMKLIANIAVIVMNYLTSKLIVFRGRKG